MTALSHNLRFTLPVSLALGALTTTLLSGCHSEKTVEDSTPTVPVATASRLNLSDQIALTAEFVPYQDVDVMAKVAGYVRNIRVDIGDKVKQGEVLATLEVPELQDEMAKARSASQAANAQIASAKSNVARAQAAYNIAHLSYSRITEVANREKGLVPQQELDMAHSRELEGQAQLMTAQANLQTAEQQAAQARSEQDRANTMLSYATIRAPFSGVITKRYANTGSMIQAGISSSTATMPVVRLAQISTLRLMLPVPVTAVNDVHVGQPVDVHVTTIDKTIPGKVTRYADSLQMSTRTMPTEVDVQNADDTLKPGMYAEVKMHLSDRSNALSVPIDAVDGLGSNTEKVYTVQDGHIHIQPVKTGLQTANNVEIISGLKEGTNVVVGRHTGLAEGDKVKTEIAAYEQKGR